MELRAYLNVLRARWWIVLPVFLLTIVATCILTSRQPVLYEAENIFVLRPRPEIFGDEADSVRAIDTLSNREQIIATIAEVANSRLVKDLAGNELALTPEQIKKFSVNARVIAGTNVLNITVQGRSPVAVRDFTNAIGLKTLDYVNGLYDVFQLETLDEAVIPTTPVSPSVSLNLAFGGILGLVLAVGLVFFAEYLKVPTEEVHSFDIIDHESGVYNLQYLGLRLQQEISRSKHNNYLFSLSLIRLYDSIPSKRILPQYNHEALRQVIATLKTELRDEDVMARYDDSTLAILLPDVTEKTAKGYISELQSKIEKISFKDKQGTTNHRIHSISGMVTFKKNSDTEGIALLARAKNTLEEIIYQDEANS